MSTFLTNITNMQAPFGMIVLVFLFISLASIVNTIAKQIRRYVCHRQELDLKRELLDRGMGVEDIERVVRASSGSLDDKGVKRDDEGVQLRTRVHVGAHE